MYKTKLQKILVFLLIFFVFVFRTFVISYFFWLNLKSNDFYSNGLISDGIFSNEDEEETQEEDESESEDEESSEASEGDTQDSSSGTTQQGSETGTTEQDQEPEPEPEPIEPQVVQCLGDSVTNGYPYSGSGSTYPSQLQSKLNAAYGAGYTTVVNRGVNGYRADNVLASVGGWLASDNPDVVLLMVGGNDLREGLNIDSTPEEVLAVINQTVSEVQGIVNICKAHTNPDGSHPKVILSAFIPNRLEGSLGSTAVALYNYYLSANVSGEDTYFTNNWSTFYDTGTGQAKASLMSDDVHPNSSGYLQMANNWYARVIVFIE